MNQELLQVDHTHIAFQDVDMEHHSQQIQEECEVGHQCYHKTEVIDRIHHQQALASVLGLDSVMDEVHHRLHGCKRF